MMQKTLVCLFHDNAAAEKAERAIERAGFDTKNVRVLSLRNAPENTGEPYAYNIPLTFGATTDHEYNAFGGLSAPTPFFFKTAKVSKPFWKTAESRQMNRIFTAPKLKAELFSSVYRQIMRQHRT